MHKIENIKFFDPIYTYMNVSYMQKKLKYNMNVSFFSHLQGRAVVFSLLFYHYYYIKIFFRMNIDHVDCKKKTV